MDQRKHQQFAELFVRNEAAVYRYIVSMIPHRADADELFQQTNLTLWTIWDRYDAGREFLPWAFGVARNEIRNFLRRRHYQPAALSDELLEELTETRLKEHASLTDRQEALSGCLGRLNAAQRELIDLCYGEERSMKLVAEQRGQTPESIYKTLQRIRDLLFDCMNRTLLLAART